MKKMIVRTYHLSKKSDGCKGKFSFVFLTDLHIVKNTQELIELEYMVEQLHPDFVLVGGDVIVAKPGKDIACAVDFMKRLSGRHMVIYADGNHEQRITKYPSEYGTMGTDYDEAIENLSIIRLRNKTAEMECNGIPIIIYGHQPDYRFYERGRRKQGMEQDLVERFERPCKDRYTILLSHNPRYEEEYFSWGADLTLSGHYHGGVVLLDSQRGIITPDFRLFCSQCCGEREKDGHHMIISAGVGEHTVPFRIHNPKEITQICVEIS